MKIVIDIDDDMYKSVVNNDAYVLGDADWILLENAIANGTPLPKEHGDLKDTDAISHELMDECYGMISDSEMKIYKIMRMLDDAPTIIEAEGE